VPRVYVLPIANKSLLQPTDLVSNLGGSLGIFTGMAIIMIFEILELICDIFFAVWRYWTTTRRPVLSSKGNKMVEYG
jgi:Amiloride-sensitive sodium channel